MKLYFVSTKITEPFCRCKNFYPYGELGFLLNHKLNLVLLFCELGVRMYEFCITPGYMIRHPKSMSPINGCIKPPFGFMSSDGLIKRHRFIVNT